MIYVPGVPEKKTGAFKNAITYVLLKQTTQLKHHFVAYSMLFCMAIVILHFCIYWQLQIECSLSMHFLSEAKNAPGSVSSER